MSDIHGPFTFPHLSDQIRTTYMVDAKNRQKYTVVVDAAKEPIGSSSTQLGENGGQSISPEGQ